MLRYKGDILEILGKAGYTQSQLKRTGYFGGGDIDKLRAGIVLGNIGLDKLCNLLKCQPGTIIEWIPDEIEKGE